MTSATFSTSLEAQQAAALLDGYRFELGGHDARQWVSLWLEFYSPSWVRDAVIEALYQGRYKSVSVRQILELWQRRAKPIRHVTHEFEAAICREFEAATAASAPETSLPRSRSRRQSLGRQSSVRQSLAHRTLASQSANNLSLLSQPSNSPNLSQPAAAQPTSYQPKISGITKKRRDSSTPTVSFNLSDLAVDSQTHLQAASPTVEPPLEALSEATHTKAYPSPLPSYPSPMLVPGVQTAVKASKFAKGATHKIDSGKRLNHKAWREFANYTTPTHAPSESKTSPPEQPPFTRGLYPSTGAIQPFKPALPFSAQTLRLAKQQTDAVAEPR